MGRSTEEAQDKDEIIRKEIDEALKNTVSNKRHNIAKRSNVPEDLDNELIHDAPTVIGDQNNGELEQSEELGRFVNSNPYSPNEVQNEEDVHEKEKVEFIPYEGTDSANMEGEEQDDDLLDMKALFPYSSSLAKLLGKRNSFSLRPMKRNNFAFRPMKRNNFAFRPMKKNNFAFRIDSFLRYGKRDSFALRPMKRSSTFALRPMKRPEDSFVLRPMKKGNSNDFIGSVLDDDSIPEKKNSFSLRPMKKDTIGFQLRPMKRNYEDYEILRSWQDGTPIHPTQRIEDYNGIEALLKRDGIKYIPSTL